MTDRESVTNAVSTAVAATGRLDAVVHNATSGASSQPHQLESVDEALWEDHVSVSLRGADYCAQAAFEALSARGGTLVVMTSAAGMKGQCALPLYSMMKGGHARSLPAAANHWQTPPWCEQAPVRFSACVSVPSQHWPVAPLRFELGLSTQSPFLFG